MYDRRLLLITAAFPPSAESGTYRPLKFVKYLKQFAWHAVVITMPGYAHQVRDETLLRQIPKSTKIVHAHLPMFIASLRQHILSSSADVTPVRDSVSWRSVLQWLRRLNALLVPDLFAAWLPFLLWACWFQVRRYKPAAILVSSPPNSSAVGAYLASHLLRLPLLVDFRDAWTVEPMFIANKYGRSRLRILLEERMERWVLGRASAIICQQATMAADYAAKYPRYADKLHVINNGFDPDDFSTIEPFSFDRPTLLHIGNLAGRNPVPLFKALMELRRFSQRADNLSLRFVGRTEPQYLAAVQQSGLEDAVKFDSPVDHRTAVSMMKGADGLLLITRGDKCELPGKLFEYLGSGRPILALAPADGEAARVVQETGAGIVVDPFDVGCIREALTQFLEWMHNRPAPPPGSLEPFTREYATRRLVAVLEQVLVPHPTRST